MPSKPVELDKQEPAEDANLVAVLEIGIPVVEARNSEALVEEEDFVARRDENALVVKCDTAQTPVPAPATPVDIHGVHRHGIQDLVGVRIDKINAAVTLALLAPPDDRRRDQTRHPALLVLVRARRPAVTTLLLPCSSVTRRAGPGM